MRTIPLAFPTTSSYRWFEWILRNSLWENQGKERGLPSVPCDRYPPQRRRWDWDIILHGSIILVKLIVKAIWDNASFMGLMWHHNQIITHYKDKEWIWHMDIIVGVEAFKILGLSARKDMVVLVENIEGAILGFWLTSQCLEFVGKGLGNYGDRSIMHIGLMQWKNKLSNTTWNHFLKPILQNEIGWARTCLERLETFIWETLFYYSERALWHDSLKIFNGI